MTRASTNNTLAGAALIAALTLGIAAPARAANMPRKTRLSVMRGVVKLIVLQRTAQGFRRVGHGSGTVIDKSGLILTNNHVLSRRGSGQPYDAVAVAPTTSFQQSPKPVCLAFPSHALRDARLDLALIKCEARMDGRPLRRRLAWSPVRIGRSSAATPGDSLFIVGYPTIGGGEITFASGEVSGFTRNYKGRWIKTTAMIGKGVSGGGAFNQRGELIGVPTLQRWRRSERVVLGLARPVALARPMLSAVRRKGLAAAVAARHGRLPRYAGRLPRYARRGTPGYGSPGYRSPGYRSPGYRSPGYRSPYARRWPRHRRAPRYQPRRHPRFGRFDGFFGRSPRAPQTGYRRQRPERRPMPRGDELLRRYRRELRDHGLQSSQISERR